MLTRLSNNDLMMVAVVNPTTGQADGTAPFTPFASGVLANTTPLVVPLSGASIPSVVTISGAASASRKIEVSTDGGSANGWFTPTNDAATATMINTVIGGNATHVRITGAAGDAWSIR